MSTPRVSVLMPVYNCARYVAEAIESILAQTLVDFELLIVDDGSTDESPAIVERYARKEPRIRVLKNPKNRGLIASLNLGLGSTDAAYVARQDADDVSLPERLRLQTELLDREPGVVAVVGEGEFIDPEGRPMRRSSRERDRDVVRWRMQFQNYFYPHTAVTFRTDVVKRLGGYDASWIHSEDYDLWARLSHEGEMVILPDVLARVRDHPDNVSTRHRTTQGENGVRLVTRNLRGLVAADWGSREVAGIAGFWKGEFPDRQHMAAIDRDLRAILDAYLARRNEPGRDGSSLRRKLAASVGRRFVVWSKSLDFLHPGAKVEARLRALAWRWAR